MYHRVSTVIPTAHDLGILIILLIIFKTFLTFIDYFQFQESCEAAEESILDLLDYCHRKFIYLIARYLQCSCETFGLLVIVMPLIYLLVLV